MEKRVITTSGKLFLISLIFTLVGLNAGWYVRGLFGSPPGPTPTTTPTTTTTTTDHQPLVHVNYQVRLPNGEYKTVNLTNDRPDPNGQILVNYIPGFVAEDALHRDREVTGQVVKVFGSTEESGPGR